MGYTLILMRREEEDSLDLFLNRIAATPLLTAEQEVELAQRIERGDYDAKEHMIEGPTCVSSSRSPSATAASASPSWTSFRGHGRPHPRRGEVRLAQGLQVLDLRHPLDPAVDRPRLADKSRVVRLPVHIGDRLRKLDVTERQLEAQNGQSPSIETVAAAVGIDVEEARMLRQAAAGPASLNETIGPRATPSAAS